MGDDEAAESVRPGERWDRLASPKLAGWSELKLAEVRGFASGAGSAALLVVHRGRLVLDVGDTARPMLVASVRKSILSALYGIHVASGTIDLSSTLEQLGIDDNEPALTETERQATICDLLKSRSGVYSPGQRER